MPPGRRSRRRARRAGGHHVVHPVVRRPRVHAVDRGGHLRGGAARAAAQRQPARRRCSSSASPWRSPRSGSSGKGEDLREAILLYSREVAFAAADVYARAAEARGLWDARLEALVVDSILTGEADEELPSRIAALGWHGHGEVVRARGHDAAAVRRRPAAAHRPQARRRRADRRAGLAARARDRPRRAARAHAEDPGPELPFLDIAQASSSRASAPGTSCSVPPVPALVDASAERARRPRRVRGRAGLAQRPAARRGGRPAARARTGGRSAREADARGAHLPPAAGALQPTCVTTLWSYLDNGRSLEATARELFVHPNTVRYRLKRVSRGHRLGRHRPARSADPADGAHPRLHRHERRRRAGGRRSRATRQRSTRARADPVGRAQSFPGFL